MAARCPAVVSVGVCGAARVAVVLQLVAQLVWCEVDVEGGESDVAGYTLQHLRIREGGGGMVVPARSLQTAQGGPSWRCAMLSPR